MKLLIVGCGYVGLVAAACFADVGNNVICVDNNKEKIDKLNNGVVPFYEPELQEIVSSNIKRTRLTFTTDLINSINKAEIIFICVGTPSNKDGSANLEYVFDVAKTIGKNLKKYTIIVNKSTSPVGTGNKIVKIIKSLTKTNFDIASNPEFLKQGTAVNDFMHPDRTVIGVESIKAQKILTKLYEPFFRIKNRTIIMDIKSAEMCKYASNAFLATKISFINEIANLCEKVGANIDNVRAAMIADPRIGSQFLYPGVGYGGSCFPKDVKALIKLGEENNYEMLMNKATNAININQIKLFINKIKKEFKNKLTNKNIAIWGLSFKPKTNDIREAPSLKVIDFLLQNKCKIRVYDPVAESTVKSIYNDKLIYCSTSKECLKDVDCLIIMSEWNEFRIFNYKENKKLMKNALVFDARNQFKPNEMKENDFNYISIGR